jgi:hypothetical protein
MHPRSSPRGALRESATATGPRIGDAGRGRCARSAASSRVRRRRLISGSSFAAASAAGTFPRWSAFLKIPCGRPCEVNVPPLPEPGGHASLRRAGRPVDTGAMAVCRICGATCSDHELRSVEAGGGCVSCGGSPRCAKCDHRRSDHFGSFAGASRSGCNGRDFDIQSLTAQPCACAGFTSR